MEKNISYLVIRNLKIDCKLLAASLRNKLENFYSGNTKSRHKQ